VAVQHDVLARDASLCATVCFGRDACIELVTSEPTIWLREASGNRVLRVPLQHSLTRVRKIEQGCGPGNDADGSLCSTLGCDVRQVNRAFRKT